MKYNKRVAIGIAAISATALLVSGCSGDSGGPADGTTTITFWNGFTASDRVVVEEIVENFNESQSDYKVEMTIQPWDVFYQKLLPAYSSGDGPTIAGFNAQQYPGYASKGVLEPLDAFIEGWDDAPNIRESALNSSLVDGKHYGVPMSSTATMLYYNKALFAEAGVTKPPVTLEELADLAVQLTKYDSGNPTNSVYGLAMPDHAGVNTWVTFAQANGGGVVNADGSEAIFDSEETVDTIATWTGLVRDQHISPVGLSGVDGDNLFASGKAAMYINGPWASAGFAEAGVDYGLALVPEGAERQTATLDAYNLGVDARASEEEKAGAEEFMKFWNSREQQLIWSTKTGSPPTRTDITQEELASNPTAQSFAEAVNAVLPFPNQRNYQQMNDDVVIPSVQRILNGEGTAESVLADANQQIEGLLAQ